MHRESISYYPAKIEMLPDVAIPALQEAYDAIHGRKATQRATRDRLNAELAALNLEPVSGSGFSRWCHRILSAGLRRPETAGRAASVRRGNHQLEHVAPKVGDPSDVAKLHDAITLSTEKMTELIVLTEAVRALLVEAIQEGVKLKGGR